MIPRDYQVEIALEGYSILREHMIVYLAMEERTGKSLTSILIAEMCQNVNNVQILTLKKALGTVNPVDDEEGGWLDLLDRYNSLPKIEITNYHQAGKVIKKPDLIILDEAHNYISAYPKKTKKNKWRENYSKIWNDVAKLCKGIPIIYLSATPHAQGYHMLYPQFALSKWSPWKTYSSFYTWFDKYGIPNTVWISGREVKQYTEAKAELCRADVDHLFITRTRKELGFDYEPNDKVHYIKLDKSTREQYNELLKHRVIELFEGVELIADTPMKLRTSLHMIESGVAKLSNVPENIADLIPKNVPHRIAIRNRETRASDLFIVLQNDEKCLWIASRWDDTEDLVIYYYYIAEKIKLEAYFKKAQLLQATSSAEGIDLAHVKTIVVYSQGFQTAKHTQRRARQASKSRTEEIVVHYPVVEDAVSEQVYETVSMNKLNFVDSRFERLDI